MPTYTAKCPTCGTKTSYFAKIDNRNITPDCCGASMTRLLDTPMVQAQTISGIITCSDGTQHEGHTSFERHMQKHNYLTASEVKAEAAKTQSRINDAHEKSISDTVDALFK